MLGLSRSYKALAVHARSADAPIATYDFTQGSLPSGVSFARASSAVYFDGSGNRVLAPIDTPRFEFDPSTLAPLGLLVEDHATNLLHWNNDLSQSAWTSAAFNSTSTTMSAPDGQITTGWSLGEGYVYQDISSTSGTEYTTSVWLKANQPCTLGFRILRVAGAAGSATFNASLSVGTEWERFEVNGTATESASRFLIDGRSLYGFGASGLEVFIWRPQLETGSSATSEIETLSSSASRAGDVVSLMAHNGLFDMRVTYGTGDIEELTDQTLTPGWVPTLSQPHLSRIDIFPSGTL